MCVCVYVCTYKATNQTLLTQQQQTNDNVNLILSYKNGITLINYIWHSIAPSAAVVVAASAVSVAIRWRHPTGSVQVTTASESTVKTNKQTRAPVWQEDGI